MRVRAGKNRLKEKKNLRRRGDVLGWNDADDRLDGPVEVRPVEGDRGCGPTARVLLGFLAQAMNGAVFRMVPRRLGAGCL